MSDNYNAIMDAAEKRIRIGGFNGFSFRDIAADVGIKSSSVHYHFPTKEDLAAAVVRRYTEEVSILIDERMARESNPKKVWTVAFRGTLSSIDKMCPCAVLGASALDLPPVVVEAVKGFFKMCQMKMISQGLSHKDASELLATLMGAMVVANAMGDVKAYDEATVDLFKREATAA